MPSEASADETHAIDTVAVTTSPDRVVLDLAVSPSLHQPYGIVHGGVYCALAEQAATLGGAAWLDGRQRGTARATVVGTQFLRSVREGTVRAEATPVHRGRGQQLWQVRMTTREPGRDQDSVIAISEVRLANLPAAAPRP